MNPKYNESPFFYRRRKTREVKVGDVGIGGNNPIRVQSMITANTRDTKASVAQIKALWLAGSEVVRVTVPSQADADNLPNIRRQMKEEKITVPLVADIHFTPQVALKCVEWVEKVRINPGNFADKKKFDSFEYTDAEYQAELDRIEEVFTPLVLRAKELGVAMRIGTNHGSLSDRIMNRYGDTPEGMVESALEFIRIAERNSYYDIVVSMKASNPQTMVQAYRLLVSRFYELKMDYPLHLGVTEAGDGKDGRIKSAAGIGSLLEDGLGDTIRVSLTEDPVEEIPVAQRLVQKYNLWLQNGGYSDQVPDPKSTSKYLEFRDPYSYQRFYSKETHLGSFSLGDNAPVRVELPISIQSMGNQLMEISSSAKRTFRDLECLFVSLQNTEDLVSLASWKKKGIVNQPISVQLSPELLESFVDFAEETLAFQKLVIPGSELLQIQQNPNAKEFLSLISRFAGQDKALEVVWDPNDLDHIPSFLQWLREEKLDSVLFSLEELSCFGYRKLAYHLKDTDFPIVLQGSFADPEEALYETSIHFGSLLLDGIGDVLRIQAQGMSSEEAFHLSYDILQATRLRLSKTEYISCPSCGRTMFDLQSTTAKIKKKTGHLKGVKIAVMGCIVNGPGEMADADFGYVGAGIGKVHLYKGKEIVMKGVSEDEADSKLVELIKENGMWIDPES